MGNKNKLLNSSHLDNVDVIKNITSVFEYIVKTASEQDLYNAFSWYEQANVWCAIHAQAFKLDTFQMCGIVAAISPQLSWNKNKEQALLVCAKLATGQELTGLMAYPANLAKAKRIYNGENPLSVLGGMKVMSFYHNLLLDDSFVTVDRHAMAIALYGLDMSKSGQIAVTDKLYRLTKQAYIDVAKRYNVPAYVVQSVSWTYKAMNGGRVSA